MKSAKADALQALRAAAELVNRWTTDPGSDFAVYQLKAALEYAEAKVSSIQEVKRPRRNMTPTKEAS